MNAPDAESLQRLSALLNTPDLPSLGPETRAGRWESGELNGKLNTALASRHFHPNQETCIRSLILLWHDYLDESHTLSQNITSVDGSFLHAIMHRREPDYWNSKYWFNRVGAHPAFPMIEEEVKTLLTSHGYSFALKTVQGGHWRPNEFVVLCEAFAGKAGSSEYKVLQQVQQIELVTLLKALCSGTK